MTERKPYSGVGPAYTQVGKVLDADGLEIGDVGLTLDAALVDAAVSRDECISDGRGAMERSALQMCPNAASVEWGPMLRHEAFAFEAGLPVT